MNDLIEQINADVSIEAEGVTAYYQIFLMRTQDKVIEAMETYLSSGTKTSVLKTYKDIFEAREYARKRIEETE